MPMTALRWMPHFFLGPFCERLGVFSQAAAFTERHPKMFFFFFSKRSGF
jgi:hypothetical protein